MLESRAATSFTGAVATPHTLATEAGNRAFRDGGSAIDAAIAAAAVLTVVYPHNVALGGDLIALVRTPERRCPVYQRIGVGRTRRRRSSDAGQARRPAA